MSDLHEVIEDSISDATSPTPVEATPVEAAPADPVEAPVTDAPAQVEAAPVETPVDTPVEDAFAKEHGLAPQMAGGRENRIPYSRVKAIVEKAQQKATGPLSTELKTVKDQVTQYESRLQDVARFEKIMVEDPNQFLTMLAKIPAYRQIFEGLVPKGQAQSATPVVQQAPADNGMPQPDLELADGSKGYTLEGLQKLMDWRDSQVEQRVTKQVESRYKPIESAWQQQEYMNKIIPQIQAQIADARTWPQFKENEDTIVKVLQANPQVSLEAAYRHVVFPKLQQDREKMRADILAEIKKAPASTALPAGSQRPAPTAKTGPKSLTDIINESIQQLK